ncbi:MAG: MmcQ/YjbR family DNA-binding protein [Clostridiales bacterium]|nr:MmcQ/YjbR family DNA-binding protein [Clostridiales bacterium]
MKYPWIDTYLLGKPGVTRNDENWNWQRYMLGDKMFAAVCLDDNDVPYCITMKLDPLEGEMLRRQYADIFPGHYMNKLHWNSVRPDGDVPDDLLRHMLDESYRLILKGFSKKKQAELLGGQA